MAQARVNLNAVQFSKVSLNSPNTVINNGAGGNNGGSGDTVTRAMNGSILFREYIGFDAMPNNLRNKRLYSVEFTTKANSDYNSLSYRVPAVAGAQIPTTAFIPSSLTWNTQPPVVPNFMLKSADIEDADIYTFSIAKGTDGSGTVTAQEASYVAAQFLSCQALNIYCISHDASKERNIFLNHRLAHNGDPPYVTVIYDDSENVISKITPKNCPTGGYVNPASDRKFEWTFEPDDTYSCFGSFTPKSARLYWKTTAESSWHYEDAASGASELTVSAGTFPANVNIEWYLQGSDANDTSSTSSTYTFSTIASAVYISDMLPNGSVQDGSREIVFSWSYLTASGDAPANVDMAWRNADESAWNTVLSNAPWVARYVMPANTLPGAEIQWRVRGINSGGTAGDYSTANFIAYVAPTVYNLSATEVPYSTLSWQAENQQAFECDVDGVVYGPYFGADKQFAIPDYLKDGDHTIRLRVLGAYSLWSEWAETQITIVNIPGDEVTLNGSAKINVDLYWSLPEGTEDSQDFYVYRDDVLIAHTKQSRFVDRFTTGTHEYYIVNKLGDGNYTKSNILSRYVCLKDAQIALLSGGDWLAIKYAQKDQSDPVYDESVETVYNHLSGSQYPSVFISDFHESSLSYSAAFIYTQEADHKAFRKMLGKPVVLKLKDGTVFVGVLDSWARSPAKHYYTAYTFTIRRIEWEDYVDDTG